MSSLPWGLTDKRNAPGAGYGDEPLRAGVDERGEVNRLVVRSGRIGVEPGQEEQVLHDVAEAFALRADAADSGLIALAFSRRAQRQADLGLYDRERGPQLVGSVRGELELAAASLFYGPRRHQPDGQGTQEHGYYKDGAGDQLSPVDDDLDVLGVRQALSTDQPGRAKRDR